MPIDLVEELTALRRTILRMGAEVEQRVHRAIDALVHHDVEAAMDVRRGDQKIDQMEVGIEEECLRVLALSNPVAGDLRFVLAVMRINSNLERIADMAKGIAKRVLDLEHLRSMEMPESLRTMAEESHRMLSDAMEALADQDVALAQQVRAADDRVDHLQKEIFAWAIREIPRHVENTEAVIDVLSITRKFERIADVATNIAEDVIFLIKGAIVRHGGINHSSAAS